MNDSRRPQIRSTLSSDPDFADLVQDFVNGIPAKIELIANSLQGNRRDELQRHIHRLRGACGGYGFQPMTEAAADIEERMKAGESLNELAIDINQFLEMLAQATV